MTKIGTVLVACDCGRDVDVDLYRDGNIRSMRPSCCDGCGAGYNFDNVFDEFDAEQEQGRTDQLESRAAVREARHETETTTA